MSILPAIDQCPYRGLVHYGEKDAPFFFGREGWCTIILNNLLASPLTLLYGPSGVGKSSVLLAGVANRLKLQAKAAVDNSDAPEKLILICRDWRDDPLIMMREEIQSQFQALMGRAIAREQEQPMDVHTLLKTCAQALVRVEADGTKIQGKLLLILDQFEEYFLYHPYESGVGTFAETLSLIVNDPELPVHVLISLREDFLAQLDLFKTQIPTLFANRLRIDHLDRDSAIDAILKPVQEFNRRLPADSPKSSVEPLLIKDVLEQVRVGRIKAVEDDVADPFPLQQQRSPETLRVESPFLQLVMMRLWEEESQYAKPPRLRQATLTRLGGASTIVRAHLERLMEALPEASQRVAAIIFEKLVTSGLTKIAYPVFELTDRAKVERPEDVLNRKDLQELLEKLSGSEQRILRRIATPPEQHNGEDRYEIFHDVLAKPILEWRRNYRQTMALEAEKQRHAAELEQERQRRKEELERERERRRKLLTGTLAMGGLLTVLGGWTVSLIKQNQNLQNKDNVLNVIESAQQFKAKQLDEIEALVNALEAAHSLEESGARETAITRDVGSNLRYILDNIQERQRIQLLTPEELQTNSVKMARILLHDEPNNKGSVTILMRDGRLILRSFDNQNRPHSAELEYSNPQKPPSLNQRKIEAIALSETGNRFATLSYQKENGTNSTTDTKSGLVEIWDHSDQRPRQIGNAFTGIRKESGRQRLRHRLAMSPNGQQIATASLDGILRIIPLQPSAGSRTSDPLAIKRPGIDLVRFSKDGRMLAIHDENGIQLIDPTTGKPIERSGPIKWPQSAKDISSMEFSPDGKLLAVALTNESKIQLFSVQGDRRGEMETSRVEQLRFSPDGRFLAVGSRDASAKLWDISTTTTPTVSTTLLNQAAVVDLRFTQNNITKNQELITFSAAGTLHRWQLPKAKQTSRAQPAASSAKLSSLAFNPATNGLAWSDLKREVTCLLGQGEAFPTDNVWSANCLKLPQSANVSRLQFRPDGGVLAGLRRGKQRSLVLWTRPGQMTRSFLLDQVSPPFSRISFSPDHQAMALVAKGEASGQLLLCQPRTVSKGGDLCTALSDTSLDVSGVQFLNQPQKGKPEIVMSMTDGRLCLVTLKDLESLKVRPATKTETWTNNLKNLLKAKCRKELSITSGQGELAISSDDAWIGLAGINGNLHLWQWQRNTYQKAKASPIEVSTGLIQRVTFSPKWDAKRRFLATVTFDGTVSLWNPQGQQLARFSSEGNDGGGFMGVEFDQKGKNLYLWKKDGSLQWEPVQDLPILIDLGCKWLQEYRKGLSEANKTINQRLRFCGTGT